MIFRTIVNGASLQTPDRAKCDHRDEDFRVKKGGIAALVRVKNMYVFLWTHLSGALDLLSGVNNAR